jgi:hypothetical protein
MGWQTQRGHDGLLHVVDESGAVILTSAPPARGESDEVSNARARLAAQAPDLKAQLDALLAEDDAKVDSDFKALDTATNADGEIVSSGAEFAAHKRPRRVRAPKGE